MLHLLRAAAVHLCKDTAIHLHRRALPAPQLCPLSIRPQGPGPLLPMLPIPRQRCLDLQDGLPRALLSFFPSVPCTPFPLSSALPGLGRLLCPIPPAPSAPSPAWHRRPVYPARQRQEKSVPRSSQVPPFAQGLRKQGEGAARSQGHYHPSLSCTLASGLHWGAPTCSLTPAWANLAGARFWSPAGLCPPYLSRSAARRSLGDSHTCTCRCSGSRCRHCDRGLRHTSPASLGAEGITRVRCHMPTTAAPPLVLDIPELRAFTGTLLTSRHGGRPGSLAPTPFLAWGRTNLAVPPGEAVRAAALVLAACLLARAPVPAGP